MQLTLTLLTKLSVNGPAEKWQKDLTKFTQDADSNNNVFNECRVY
jgi:hypothetical protein